MAGVGNRNAAWKTAIDGRAASGGQLGLAYLEGLSSQYGIPLSQLTAFASKQGYQVGAKAQAATTPAAPTTPSAPATDYERVSLKDIGSLQSYLTGKLPNGGGLLGSIRPTFGANPEDVPGLRQLSDFMGVKNINSEKEIRNALNILGGIQSPMPAALAPRAGVTNYNSLNDYLKILGGGAMGSGSAGGGSNANPGGTPINPTGTGGGGRGGRGDSYSPEIPTMPDAPEFQYTPGGPGASVDGSATSFRRKRSSARMAGLTTKGTGQFKISGQTTRSSGLNIGTP